MPYLGTDVFTALLKGSVDGGPELQSAQQLLSTLMDSLSSSVFWKDLDSRYLGCNQTFADHARPTIEEMIGKSDAEMPWAAAGDHYIEWDTTVLSEGRAVTNVREPLRDVHGRNLWISTNKAPLRDADGNVIGLVGTFREVTQEVAAETRAQRSLQELDLRVTERTDQLLRANHSLRKEVDERVRLQAEERQLREYSEIRREIGTAMSRTMDLDKVLEVLVGGVHDLVANDVAAIALADSDGQLHIERIESAYGYDVADKRPATEMLRRHPSLNQPGVPVGTTQDQLLPATLGPAKSTIAAEMVTGGVLIGYVVLESRWSDFYVPEHGDRLKGVAEQASAVISNIRLTEQAAVLAAAAERDRLRRDLHDSVVQTLAAAALTVDTQLVHMDQDDPVRPAFERIQRLAGDAHTELRELLREMRPMSADGANLVDLVLGAARGPDWPFSIDVTTNLQRAGFFGPCTAGIFRVVQEALHNASRHSQASRVVIDIRDHPKFHITVTDDGIGFDPALVRGDHQGLSIMAERVEEACGKLDVRSTIGEGTVVEITIDPDTCC